MKRLTVFMAAALLLVVGALVLRRALRPAPSPDAGAFTIYVLGASTAMGAPFDYVACFGRIASAMFGGDVAGREIRVVNLARRGLNARAVSKAARKVGGDADVVFLYAGNNEFLRLDRRHDLRVASRRMFDQALFGPEKRREVLEEYERTMEGVVARLSDAGIPVILSSVAVNMSDWEPNRSVLADPDHELSMRTWLEQAEEALTDGRVQDAVVACTGALHLEPGFALAHKRLGDCYRHMGRPELAWRAYQQAVNHDANPTRILEEQNQALRRIAQRQSVPLVDAEGILREASPDGLVGFNLMWDNCHPTLEGQALIAAGFAQAMRSRLGLEEEPRPLDEEALREALGLDDEALARGLISMGGFCYRTSTLVWDPSFRLERAWLYFESARALGDDSAELHCSMAVASALGGEIEKTAAHWKMAHERDPRYTEKRMQRKHVRQIMERIGLETPVFR